MPDEKPQAYGTISFILAMLLLVAVSGAYLYTLEPYVPTLKSSDASLLFNGEVMATFPASELGEIREGLPTLTKVAGYGNRAFPGIIRMIHRESDGSVSTMIRLQEMPTDVAPPVKCKVTVKLTKPPTARPL